MTHVQKLQIRQSELRQQVNAQLDIEIEKRSESFDDDLGKLSREMRSLEGQLQAALLAEPAIETRSQNDAEGRELRDIVGRARLGNIFDSVIERRSTSGAEDELQKHYGLGPHQVPLALLETRAVSAAPANVGQNQNAIIDYVFPDSCAAFMGVDMPSVPVGEAIFPVLTSKLSVEALAEHAAGTETDGAFSAEVLTPSRLQASFFFSREDRARFAGMEESLRENLSMGLSSGLDEQVLAGTNGLFTGTVLANHAASVVTTFEQYKANFAYARVDGRYASSVGELRSVMGSATYAHAATAYRANGNAADAVDAALNVLMSDTAGVKVSAYVPAVASSKQNAVIRLGMRRDMVAPIWNGIDIIYDEITKAANGQIVITAVMLYAVKLLRADGFYKQETQHA